MHVVVRHGAAHEREQFLVARASTLVLGALAIVLGILFQGQNVAFMVGLAFAIAASANFPALVLSMFWRWFSTRGAQASMLAGPFSALLLIYFSRTIQVGVLGGTLAPFPLTNPGLVSIPLAFAVGIAVSLLASEPEAVAKFAALEHRLASGRTPRTAEPGLRNLVEQFSEPARTVERAR